MLVSGCVLSPLSEQALRREIPVAQDAAGDDLALITYSFDEIYESELGVPYPGDPLICGPEGLARVNSLDLKRNQIYVNGGEEIAVTSVIRWSNTGFMKTCWEFVAFTPESGVTYVVVNEIIGGKGISALWTGIGLQTCEVSVFRRNPSGVERIVVREALLEACQHETQ